MSEITTTTYQRHISDVTRDIKVQTGLFLRTAIEIGRLLFEAKAMVEPGGWGKYIEEELPFSHAWANNYMKLYKEYGSDQTSLFGDSQAFMNLRPTQALELLALPADDREAFVDAHDVADMSTRQLHQEVQAELEKVRQEKDLAEAQLSCLEIQTEELGAELDEKDRKLAQDKVRYEETIQELKEKAASAQKAQEAAEQDAQTLKDQLSDAEKKAKEAMAELKKAKESPEVPASVMERLRKEAEAAAAKEAAEKLQKQLDAANQSAKKAEEDRKAAEAAAQEAQEKLDQAQKAAKIANPNLQAVQVLGQKLLTDWNVIMGHKKAAATQDPANAGPLKAYLEKVLAIMAQALEDKTDEA